MPARRIPVHALVVDYGEVLCEAPDPDAFAAMAHVAGAGLTEFADVYWRHRPAYDRGELHGPAYWAVVGEELGTPLDASATTELVARDIALWADVDEPMLAWANAIARSGMPVGLLSNMVSEIGAHLRDTLRLFDDFASVTYSYEVGAAKPDPRIYQHALSSLGVDAHEALLVDDRLPNIEAARELGMHAHHFRGRVGLLAEIDERYDLLTRAS